MACGITGRDIHVLLIGMWDYIEVISSCSGMWGHVGNIE